MVRNRNKGMIGREREKRRGSKDTSLDGFNFRFDGDEDLKRDYVASWNYFNKKLKTSSNIPKPSSISYIEAKGMISGGSYYKRLNRLLIIKNQEMDFDWEDEGQNHKQQLFKEYSKEAESSKSIQLYLRVMEKFLNRLSKLSGTSIEGLLNRTRVKYNIVWYQNHPNQPIGADSD